MILAVAVPLAAVMSYIWWQALQEGRARELRLLQMRVALIDRDLQRLWNDAEWVLPRMAARPAFRELSPDACDDEMAVLRDVNTAFLAVTLWSREARLVCSSFPLRPDRPPPEAHPKSFVEGLAVDGLYLSDVFPGQITGLHLVTFTFPVKDAKGAVKGLLSLPVRTEYFEKLLLDLELGAGSAAGIIDRNLKLVVRVPDNPQWQGKSVAPLPGVLPALQAAQGTFETTGIDGVRRIVAQRASPKMGWRAYVGVEESVLFAGFRRQMQQGIAAFIVVVAVSVVLAYLIGRSISRPLQDLVRVADTVAQGDRTARALAPGGGEIARMADHLNRMLDALERSEFSLQESNRRLRELSGRLLGAQEEERLRISRGLHDQVGQELTAIKIRLDTLAQSVQDPAQRARVLEVANATGETLQRVRRISVDLRPPQLDALGLAAALRAHVERQAEIGKTALHFESDASPRMETDLEIRCFRVAQEALNNVLRHSQAQNAWLRLAIEGGSLILTVRDDGIGFDMEALRLREPGKGGIGLLGMQERVTLAGGTLDIRSEPGQGCVVKASFPAAATEAGA